MNSSEAFIAPVLVDRLAQRIEAEMGWSFPDAKRRDLMNAVHRMAEEMAFDHEECIDWLLYGRWDKAKADLCALHLTIGETYFFREPRAFDLVCDHARKIMKDGDRKLRIWSAGCCTGEEAYSIAMALRNAAPELDPRRFSILATDINNHNLQLARAGVYRQWSFRNNDTTLQKRNFSEDDKQRFRINDEIKDLVRFAELNLAAPVYPSVSTDTHAMDIIFCRNVLMYFSPSQAMSVIERFRQCLVDGGWLIVSPSEASREMFAGFSAVYHPDAIYFQKSVLPNDIGLPRHSGSLADTAAAESAFATLKTFSDRAVPAKSAQRPDAPATSRQVKEEKPSASAKREAITNLDNGDGGLDAVRRARILANEGHAAEALRCLEQAVRRGPPAAELYHAMALIAMEAGDHRQALQSFKRAIYLDPDFILAHYLIGVLYSAQHRDKEATRQFEVAAELLSALDDDTVVSGSDGLPAGYLLESVRSRLRREDA